MIQKGGVCSTSIRQGGVLFQKYRDTKGMYIATTIAKVADGSKTLGQPIFGTLFPKSI